MCAIVTTWKACGEMPREYESAASRLPWAKSHCALRRLRRIFLRHTQHRIQRLPELLKAWRGNDDGIPAATDILGDSQEPAARIFHQRKNEGLSFNLNLVGL